MPEIAEVRVVAKTLKKNLLNKKIKSIEILYPKMIDSNIQEFTIELNPESTTKEKLEFLYKSNISRISFGLQSIFDDNLNILGRLHNYEKFKNAYYCAKEIGFININVDLIYGIPNQTLQNWTDTLKEVINFRVVSITAEMAGGTFFVSFIISLIDVII